MPAGIWFWGEWANLHPNYSQPVISTKNPYQECSGYIRWGPTKQLVSLPKSCFCLPKSTYGNGISRNGTSKGSHCSAVPASLACVLDL